MKIATGIISLQDSSFDIWPIYNAIKKYYPIGLNDKNGFYRDYEGQKELEKLLVENIHNKENFEQKWMKIANELDRITKKKWVGTTRGQAPSYSGSLILEEVSHPHGKVTKELCFSVSLLGPFYQVYGKSQFLSFEEGMDGQKKISRNTPFLIISPFGKWAESFQLISKFIEDKFPGYKFVPFKIGREKIIGLQTHYLDAEHCTIYQALFNDYMEINNFHRRILGDYSFGMDV